MPGEQANPPPSLAERRMARRKALIQEHIAVAERAIVGRHDEREREALVAVVAGLRRRAAELDAEGDDAEAWSVAHPPRRTMPEARVAYYRAKAETTGDRHAAWIVREYETYGYFELFQEDEFGFPPYYFNLLLGMPVRPDALSG